jgi:hypothetical protein
LCVVSTAPKAKPVRIPKPAGEARGGRLVKLSEEEREREELIEAITRQGYNRAHAEHVLEFNEREGRE